METLNTVTQCNSRFSVYERFHSESNALVTDVLRYDPHVFAIRTNSRGQMLLELLGQIPMDKLCWTNDFRTNAVGKVMEEK